MFDNNYIFKIKTSCSCRWILILFLSLSVQYSFANIVFDDELNSNGTVEHVEKNKKNESLNKQEQRQGKVEFDEDFDDEKKISNKSIKTHDLQTSSPNNKKNKSTKNNNDDDELIEYINNDIDIDEEIKKYESLSDELILLNVKHAKPVLIEYDSSIKKGNEFNQNVKSDTKQNILTNINFFLVKLYFLGLLFCTSIIYCIKVIYDIFSTRKKFKKHLQSLHQKTIP